MQIIARGGKALYGAPLGILMLEARFPRIPGDMGNAATWPFPAATGFAICAPSTTRGTSACGFRRDSAWFASEPA